jgi:hypothetical protein
LRYRYVSPFQNLCITFLGGDEVIFTVVLFVLQKLVDHPVRRSEVNLAPNCDAPGSSHTVRYWRRIDCSSARKAAGAAL